MDPRWVVESIVISVRDPQVTPSYVYRWGESTNLICFAMFNNSLIETPQATSDILLSPCSGSKCAGTICIFLHQWKGQPIRCIEEILKLYRHKEDIIWGACEHDGRPQLSVEDTTGTQTYAMGINSNNNVGIDYVSDTMVRHIFDRATQQLTVSAMRIIVPISEPLNHTQHVNLCKPHMVRHLSSMIVSTNDQIQEGVYTSTVERQPMLLLWMVMY